MKKIIIFSVLFLFGLLGCAFAGCPISELDACKADIGSGINTHIQDKVLPNNLDKLIKPQNTMESHSLPMNIARCSVLNLDNHRCLKI